MHEKLYTLEKQVVKTIKMNYILQLPTGYEKDPGIKWPLILFLHGAGERGDDISRVKVHGIPKLMGEGEGLPFIAVSPQCPANSWWGAHVEALESILEKVIHTCSVDEERVYLTGLSMGGYGTWMLAALHPEKFTAIAPICGGGAVEFGFPEKVCALKETPVWVFHGAKDDAVPISESEILVDTLKKCGGNVRFTVYPDAGHDSWTETYNNPELYEWFLNNKR